MKNQRSQKTEETDSAFTLIEIILAIAVAGLVLASAASFLVSISNIWIDRQERNFFEDHVDGVTEFLRASLDSAGMEVATSTPSETGEPTEENNEDNGSPQTPEVAPIPEESRSEQSPGENADNEQETKPSSSALFQRANEPITWANPPGFASYQEPLINFKLSQVPPLFISPANAPVAGIDVFIHFEPDEGLSLLWYSTLQEEAENLDDLQRTEISPLIKAISYVYWDERFEQWEEEESPKEGDGDDQFILPRFLKLTFEYDGVTKERTITIPVQSRSALIF